MPASVIVKLGRGSECLSWGLHLKNIILQCSPPLDNRSSHPPALLIESAMLAHLPTNPSSRLEILYWFFFSIPTTLPFPLALSLTGLLIPARALITRSTKGTISPNTIPKLRIRGGVSRR